MKQYRIPIQVLVYPVRYIDNTWEYLMLKRVENRGGFWQGVTGAPENGETLYEGAKRELFEETGYTKAELIQTDVSFIIPMEDRWIDIYPKDTKIIPEYLFIAEIKQNDTPIIDPVEHNEWKWCDFEEALNLLRWEDNKKALKYVRNFLSNSID